MMNSLTRRMPSTAETSADESNTIAGRINRRFLEIELSIVSPHMPVDIARLNGLQDSSH